MITITRALARRVRSVFTRALGVSARTPPPAVLFQSGPRGLTIRARGPEAAVEYRLPGRQPSDRLALPLSALRECESAGSEPITLTREGGGQVLVSWTQQGVPRTARHQAEVPAAAFPRTPARMEPNSPRLLGALRDAAQTADREAARYALGCLQLRPERGRVVATDSRQLLAESGFRFPWEGDRLVPAHRALLGRQLPEGEPVEIGSGAGWVTIRAGAWTIHLAAQTQGRFPAVDHLIPEAAAPATVDFSDSDAEFLLRSLDRLPGGDDADTPVTLDAGGGLVAVRARADGEPVPTELVLTGSRVTGEPLRCRTSRVYLARALHLGFRRLRLFGPAAPAVFQDDQRSYVWALLGAEDAVPPHENAVRIESPPGPPATGTDNTPPRGESQTMPQTQPDHSGHSQNDPAAESGTETASPVEQAEALRQTLRQALAQTQELVGLLKRQQKQSRLVQSTLASLRQLQTLDV